MRRLGAKRYNRRSLRLKGYDYSSEGAYFVTFVTRNRERIFGQVIDGEIRLNEAGKVEHAPLSEKAA